MLITCRECAHEVSTAAKACPQCGASGKSFRSTGKKPMGLAGKIGIGFLGLMGVGSAVGAVIGDPADRPKTAEEQANTDRRYAAYQAAAALRRSLREPDSAVFEHARVDAAAKTVCLVYRARNGFGGMGRERVVFVGGVPSQRSSVWNRHCAHKSLYDYTDAANYNAS